MMKYHRLGGLNNNLFLTVLEAGKSKIKVLEDSISSESPLLSLQTDTFSLKGVGCKVGRKSSPVFSYKCANPIMKVSPS